MHTAIRSSANRIKAVGRRNADWSQQSTRFISPKTGEAKQVRRKCMRRQLFVDGFTVDDNATINMVEMVRVPVVLKNGSIGEREQMIGRYKGRRVVRTGSAPSFTDGNRTPNRWQYS